MGNQIRNMLIGIFIIVACSLAVVLVMFLKPSTGNGEKTLYVRFSNINNINIHTRVLFAGRPVGEVAAIDEIYDIRSQPTDMLGDLYVFQLTLKVDSSVLIYDTDEIALQTSGLLGEKSIAIIPKAPPKGKIPKLITNEPIYAESTDPIQNAFSEISEVAADVKDTFRQITHWIEDHGEDIAYTICTIGDAMKEIRITVAEVNRQKLIQEINAILSKVNTLMNDINNYGLLFHLNKHWQRLHIQRIKLLDSLNTPQKFKDYFEKEVDMMQVSMERLGMLVDRAKSSPENDAFLHNPDLQDGIDILLRRSENLSEQLRLFQQQFVEGYKCSSH